MDSQHSDRSEVPGSADEVDDDDVQDEDKNRQLSVTTPDEGALESSNVMTVPPEDLPPEFLQLVEQMSLHAIPKEANRRSVLSVVNEANIYVGNSTQAALAKSSDFSDEQIHRVEKIFVKTRGYEHILETLKDLDHVLICGSPGSGKTTLSTYIMNLYKKKNYEVRYYRKVSKFEESHVNLQAPTLLVFDDFFGRFSPTSREMVDCREVLEFLKTRLEEKRKQGKEDDDGEESTRCDVPLKVIMNSRTNIWEMVQRNLLEYQNSLFRSSSVADLTTLTKLSDTEKVDILRKHLQVGCSDILDNDEIGTIAQLGYKTLGFPHLCELFVDSLCPKEKAFEFFQKPMQYLVALVENIFVECKARACMLLLMILNDGFLSLLDLQDPETRKETGLDEKLELCKEIIGDVPGAGQISEKAKQEKNTLVVFSNDIMQFSHPTIHDAVAFVVGNKNPGFVLKNCSMHFITERTEVAEKSPASSGGDYQTFKIILSSAAVKFLLKRLAREIISCNFSLALSHQCLLSKETVSILFNEMTSKNNDYDYMHSVDKTHGRGFLFWSSFICMGPVTELSFQFTSFSLHEVLEGCFGCCMSGNVKSMKSLVSKTPFSQAIASYTLASILESQTETRPLYRSLSSVGSPPKVDVSQEKETARMHGDNRDMLIHIATANGFKDIVEILLNLGTEIDALGGNQMTALMYACYLGHVDLVRLLLEKGANAGLLDEEGDNCLHLACRGGSLDIVKILVEKQMDMDQHGEHDRTPLMYASYNGYEDIVRFLLEKGAIAEPICNKENALHSACVKGQSAIARLLLVKAKIDIELRGEHDRTPIMYACRHGHLETAKLLEDLGANLNTGDVFQSTCLHLAAIGGHVQTAEWILKTLGADTIDCLNMKGRSPLMMAFQYGQPEMIEFLLQKKANFSLKDKEEALCLHFAAKSGMSRLVDLCLDKGQDINSVTTTGLTPVKAACLFGNLDALKHLVEKGADVTEGTSGVCLNLAVMGGNGELLDYLVETFPCLDINSPGFNGLTPVMMTCKYALSDMFRYLIKKGADITAQNDFNQSCLHLACRAGCLEIVKRLVDSDLFNIDQEDENKMTPLTLAVRSDSDEVIEYLVQKGADIHRQNSGRSYLHEAARHGKMKSCLKLLQFGLRIDVLDDQDRTPLMSAVSSSQNTREVTEFLLEKDNNIHHRNKRNDTALHIACFSGHPAQINVLLDHGFDINVRGDFSQTPLFSACRGGNRKAFDVLVRRNADLHLLNSKGESCLHVASSARSDDDYISCELIRQGLDFDARDRFFKTPTMHAVSNKKFSILKILLQKGCHRNTFDQWGIKSTLLHYACSIRDMDDKIPNFLLVTGRIDIDARDRLHQTPIMCAARHGNSRLVEYLMSLGANLRLVDKRVRTCASHAAEGGHYQLAQYLVGLINQT